MAKTITPETKQSIKNDYLTGNFSYKKLAEKYEVSRQSIYLVLHPEKKTEYYKKQAVKSPEKNKRDCKKYQSRKKQL